MRFAEAVFAQHFVQRLMFQYGYYFVIGVIVTIAMGMVLLFKKVRWL